MEDPREFAERLKMHYAGFIANIKRLELTPVYRFKLDLNEENGLTLAGGDDMFERLMRVLTDEPTLTALTDKLSIVRFGAGMDQLIVYSNDLETVKSEVREFADSIRGLGRGR